MRTYSPNIAAMRKKVKKVHNKNRMVGLLYLLGTLALIVLAFFPCLKIEFADGGDNLSILSFYKALLLVFQGNIVALFVFLLYLVMTLLLLIIFFRIFSQFRRVLRKNDRNVNACNRNLSAMEKMGDMFSFVFTLVAIMNFVIYVITPIQGDIMIKRNSETFTMFGYLFLGVGLLIHFLAGAIGGTSSLFIVGISIEERKRADSIFIYVIRNLIQVIATACFVYFVAPILTVHVYLKDFDFSGLSNMSVLIGFLLQIVAIVFIILSIRQSMSTIEFNLMGMDAVGMHRAAIFALLTGIVCIAAYFMDMNWTMDPPAQISNYLFAGIAGVVCFLANMFIHPYEKKEKEPEEIREWKDLKQEKPEEPKAASQQQPQQTAVAPSTVGLPTSIDLNLVLPKRNLNGCPEDCAYANVGVLETKFEVVCPTCGKKLSVKQASYHRCPACGKVFQLNVGKVGKTIQREYAEEAEEPKKVKKAKKAKRVKKASAGRERTEPVLFEELSFDAM